VHRKKHGKVLFYFVPKLDVGGLVVLLDTVQFCSGRTKVTFGENMDTNNIRQFSGTFFSYNKQYQSLLKNKC